MKYKNKKASEKYYILISIILGLVLIGIIFSWIFQEYLFGEGEMSLLKCKQSIATRNTIPNTQIFGMDFLKLKEEFPLECKTQIIEINEENKEQAGTIIAEAMASCWALYNRGEASIFPSGHVFAKIRTACFTCARITFAPEIQNTLELLNIEGQESVTGEDKSILQEKSSNGQIYWDYLTSNNQNPFLKQRSFAEDFNIIPEKHIWREDTSTIYYPRKIDPKKGDLHITVSSWVMSKDSTVNTLLFYQKAQESLRILSKTPIQNDWFKKEDIDGACEAWDGINV